MEEKEVDLRDCIRVIGERKWLILTVFLVAVITTAVATSLLMPLVYQSTASVMITPSRVQAPLSARISLGVERETATGEYMTPAPTISIPTHEVLLKATPVLERIIYKLRLTDELGKPLTLDSLRERLNVKEVTGTNILQLKAEYNDSKIAKEIANTWAQEYIQYSQELILGAVRGTGDFIAEQFEIARKSLIQAEEAIKDFDIKEGLSLMRIRLREKQSELDSNYAHIYKLEFRLMERMRFLQEINRDITAMTKDGVWLGSFSPKSFSLSHFIDENLSAPQRSLRQETLEAKFTLEEAQEKYNNFVNDSRIKLLRQELISERNNLINDKSTLGETKRLSETTEANLKSKGTLERRQAPIAENLTDSTVWEVLSLEERYNFFKSRQQFLKSKVERENVELTALEKTLFEYENELEALDENLNRAKVNYDFYFGKFKSLENAENSTKLEIAAIEFQLSQLKKFVEGLKGEIETLRKEINRKEIELLQLTRQAAIYERTYADLSNRVEEARITKAVELGEVKIVSLATEPEDPIKPKKVQMVAISGVLSLMLGTFLAFFMELRQSPKKN